MINIAIVGWKKNIYFPLTGISNLDFSIFEVTWGVKEVTHAAYLGPQISLAFKWG